MKSVTFYYYQCHDVKCIYVLTGHANWNQLKKPYLLCKCNKGDGARDNNHVCTFISDKEQEVLYGKAEKQWKKHEDNPNYTEVEHCERVANNNDGIHMWEYICHYYQGVVFDPMYFIWDVRLKKN